MLLKTVEIVCVWLRQLSFSLFVIDHYGFESPYKTELLLIVFVLIMFLIMFYIA
jgi:hypothetical protein